MGQISLTEDQLDELVTKRAEAALAGLNGQIEALKRNRDDILAEKRTEKERADALRRSLALSAYAAKIADPYYKADEKQPAPSHTLSREDARDPTKYRAAKAAALAAGVKTGPVVLDADRAGRTTSVTVPTVVESDRHLYVRRDIYRDTSEFRRLRRVAEQAGKSVLPYESRADLEQAVGRDPGALAAFDRSLREGEK